MGRHPQDLPDSDLTAIQPAVEAVIKRHQQRREAYGIDVGYLWKRGLLIWSSFPISTSRRPNGRQS